MKILNKLIKKYLQMGLDFETSTELAKNQIIREEFKFSQKLNKKSGIEHLTKFDGTQVF